MLGHLFMCIWLLIGKALEITGRDDLCMGVIFIEREILSATVYPIGIYIKTVSGLRHLTLWMCLCLKKRNNMHFKFLIKYIIFGGAVFILISTWVSMHKWVSKVKNKWGLSDSVKLGYALLYKYNFLHINFPSLHLVMMQSAHVNL